MKHPLVSRVPRAHDTSTHPVTNTAANEQAGRALAPLPTRSLHAQHPHKSFTLPSRNAPSMPRSTVEPPH